LLIHFSKRTGTEIGHSTLKAIENSSHKLIFYHSDSVKNSAGTTGAPLTKNLTNGNGENAYIKFLKTLKRNREKPFIVPINY